MKKKRFQNRILHIVPAVRQTLDDKNSADNVFELATTFNISRNSLQTVFKQECGEGIRRYKLKQRMEMAVQMLVEGKDIKEIAFSLNYSQARNFSNAFKKYYGVAPTEWHNFVPNTTTLCQIRPHKFGMA